MKSKVKFELKGKFILSIDNPISILSSLCKDDIDFGKETKMESFNSNFKVRSIKIYLYLMLRKTWWLYFVGNKAQGRISKRVFQENKTPNFPKNKHFLPLICTRTCDYQGVGIVRFSENLACIVFLKHPFWDSPFCLITDDLAAC